MRRISAWRSVRSSMEAGDLSTGVDRIAVMAGPASWEVSQLIGPEKIRPSTTGAIHTRRPGRFPSRRW